MLQLLQGRTFHWTHTCGELRNSTARVSHGDCTELDTRSAGPVPGINVQHLPAIAYAACVCCHFAAHNSKWSLPFSHKLGKQPCWLCQACITLAVPSHAAQWVTCSEQQAIRSPGVFMLIGNHPSMLSVVREWQASGGAVLHPGPTADPVPVRQQVHTVSAPHPAAWCIPGACD